MSNTSEVSVIGTCCAVAAIPVVACAAAVGAVGMALYASARWLAEETPEQTRARSILATERERSLLGPRVALGASAQERLLFRAQLHVRDAEQLAAAAGRLGYRQERLAGESGAMLAREGCTLLMNPQGERIAIRRNSEGRLDMETAGDVRRLTQVVRQHSLDRAVEHLKAQGMRLAVETLPTGEIRIGATKPPSGTASESGPRIQATVRTDGGTEVDVEGVRGSSCEQIVADLARAMGGKVEKGRRKPSFFQLPARTGGFRVRV